MTSAERLNECARLLELPKRVPEDVGIGGWGEMVTLILLKLAADHHVPEKPMSARDWL